MQIAIIGPDQAALELYSVIICHGYYPDLLTVVNHAHRYHILRCSPFIIQNDLTVN